ncbi:MAG: hypothetical protein J3R72DRAFT_506921 [Linnemannia gamsii]|nr:MAG: hypothetical protein J3R72DRAFT_506921 [Linnemannia gamsii]
MGKEGPDFGPQRTNKDKDIGEGANLPTRALLDPDATESGRVGALLTLQTAVKSPAEVRTLPCGVWDTRTGDAIYCLDSHSKGVYCLRYSPSGENIASESLDGYVRLCNTSSYSSATLYHKKAMSAASSQDGNSVLSAIDDGVPCLRDA